MKKTFILAFLLFATALLQVNAQDVANKENEEINIPCLNESFDDENSAAAWGIGKASNMREARMLATEDAINAMAQRFHINVATIETYANMWCMEMTKNDNNECVVYVSIHVSKDIIYKAIQEIQ